MPASPKYGLARRMLNSVGGSREALATSFCQLPDFLSPYAYRLARRFVFKDNLKRVGAFEAAFQEAGTADTGDYLEFGVARGTSLITAYEIASDLGMAKDMRFHAFDSFEGLPTSEGKFVTGDMSYSEAVFRRFVQKAGVPTSKITTTKGFFDRSLTDDRRKELGIEPGKAYVVHVDCDLYSSTLPVLAFVEKFLGIGSVVIFDDWFSFDAEECPWDHGEQRAFREWSMRDRFEPIAMTYPWNAAFKLVRS